MLKWLMRSKSKKSKTRKKLNKSGTSEDRSFEINPQALQQIAARSLASLFPGYEAGAKLPDDFDSRYELIYAAANQTIIKFKDTKGTFNSPIEMRATIEHDPDINRDEIAYNFRTSKFVLYTKLTDEELEEVTFDPNLNQEISKADQLCSALGKIIPSAQLKYFATQAEIMSHGKVADYKENYLPEQFSNRKDAKDTTQEDKSK